MSQRARTPEAYGSAARIMLTKGEHEESRHSYSCCTPCPVEHVPKHAQPLFLLLSPVQMVWFFQFGSLIAVVDASRFGAALMY